MFSVFSLVITPRNKLWLAAGVAAITIGLYWFSGFVAEAMTPRVLPLSPIDRLVPLLPGTVWIYLSIYFIYAASCILQKDLEVYGKFLRSYLLAYFGSTVIFLLFPTTFPREMFALETGTRATMSEEVLLLFRLWDRPTNCLPSMHVASAVLAALPFRDRRPRLFVAFLIWAAAIGVTTVTTKQHYAVDVVAGALFGWACHRFAFRTRSSDAGSGTNLVTAE